jgi:hypothetical protein
LTPPAHPPQAAKEKALAANPGGKIVNAYGQEEVGVSKREQRKSALTQMYAQSTEGPKVVVAQRKSKLNVTSDKYLPRSFQQGKYAMGTCWGLSTTRAVNAKAPVTLAPLYPRVTEAQGEIL